MKVNKTFPLLAGSLALVLFAAGCSQNDSRLGAGSDQNPTGTAMVREEPGNNQMAGRKMDDQMQQCQGMMKQGLGTADANYDHRFIDMMIPHHQGAIDMAEDALNKSDRPEIKKLARNIIDAQEKEIAQLKSWRKQWYGE